ncbi:MAG: sigma-70 family RNA polymerase sigma factor [Acidobacteria bacterium]|nr:sigma-70 family RNA polymerase sigma factor [Acidobacteriota bacterium]
MSSTATGVKLCPIPQTAVVPDTSPTPLPQPQPIPAPAPILDQEREKLLIAHLPQVRLIAEKIRERLRFAADLDDLMSYGVIGLLKAIERFDPSRGILLKTYAEHRIRGAILDGLRGMDWLSRSARQKERLYQQRPSNFQQTSAASLSSKADNATSPAPTWFHASELIYVGTNLEDFEKLSERLGLRWALAGYAENPETIYQREESRQRLALALADLPWRHRCVIQLYYYQELNMKYIAQILRVHESRVSQIHTLAIQRLRKLLAVGQQSLTSGLNPEPKKISQTSARKRSKYRVTARRSSSVSTPIVSSAVSAT